MNYELTDKAFEDYLNLYRTGVEQFGVALAEAYSDGIERIFELIAANPEMARLRTELLHPVRIHPHRSHVVVYNI